MRSYRSRALTIGVAIAATCVSVTTFAAPAQAASGFCEKNKICGWSKENYKGRSFGGIAPKGVCVRETHFKVRSVNNHTPHMINVYSKPNCKGSVASMNWGVKIKDGFMPFRSYKAVT
ncbi:peptidase inhibitor family I36 protein [Streptomyces sp. NPDC050439]|uniref:peptidase inhibitor family I36 protein n=1 Tax=unclassified Streptomyces TaxID=2593676 RepID=UPI00341EEB27